MDKVYDGYCLIDDDLRTINIPTDREVAGVEGDKNVNVLSFRVNRWYNELDLSTFDIRINYVNANGDPNFYTVLSKDYTENSVTFDWLITADATLYKGKISFNVEFIKANTLEIEYAMNTTIATLKVLEGLNVEHYIKPADIEDIIERLMTDLQMYVDLKKEELDAYVESLMETSEEQIQNATDEAIEQIDQHFNEIVHRDTTEHWNQQVDLITMNGHIYLYTDYSVVDGVEIPGIKIGDGNSYLIDMPFIDSGAEAIYDHVQDDDMHVTPEEKLFWNNKVTCYMSQGQEGNIVFTKENI